MTYDSIFGWRSLDVHFFFNLDLAEHLSWMYVTHIYCITRKYNFENSSWKQFGGDKTKNNSFAYAPIGCLINIGDGSPQTYGSHFAAERQRRRKCWDTVQAEALGATVVCSMALLFVAMAQKYVTTPWLLHCHKRPCSVCLVKRLSLISCMSTQR